MPSWVKSGPWPENSQLTQEEWAERVEDGLDDHEARLDTLEAGGINTQTGTAYTLAISDVSKVVEMNNAGANTVTVPPNSSVPFPLNTIIGVYRMGAGSTTVVAGSGVTVRNAGSLRAQYSEASLRKRATDEWVLSGDLT